MTRLLLNLRKPGCIPAAWQCRGGVDPALVLLGTLPGICLAVWLYGPALDPRNVLWLLSEGDSLQHFSGWDMFRRDVWRWPLGALPTLGSEVGASIVYTDSIPLVAVPLKLFHTWLPDPVQYIGPVMLVNLALNGSVATWLLRRQGCHRGVALAGSVLVVSLPMVTMRGPGALGHEALSSHWLILFAIGLSLAPQLTWHRAVGWLGLLIAALGIHFYLFFMVGVLWSAWWLGAVWQNRHQKQHVAWFIALGGGSVGAVLLAMYAWGYFEFSLNIEGNTGFGLYSTGLLSFFNPGSAGLFFQGDAFAGVSRLWQGWLPPVKGQYEGFAYAGAGVLLLMLAALLLMACQRRLPLASAERWIFVPLVALFVFALGNQLVVGQQVINLAYPAWLHPLTHHLRSAGRMAWPLLYGVLLASLLVLARGLAVRWLTGLLVVVVLLQLWDVSRWQGYVRYKLDQTAPGQEIMRPFAWRNDPSVVAMLRHSREIRLLPGDDWHQIKVISWLAARYGVVSNVAYFARTNPGVLYAAASAQRRELEDGHVESGVLYALTDARLVAATCALPVMRCQYVDGLTLAVKEPVYEYPGLNKEEE